MVVLFGSTVFLSAFLLFLVEPLIAKMVLPVLGGSPMVWNTCVLFFQVTLLAGYAYAHGATMWLSRRGHAIVYGGILVAPLVVLPFTLRAAEHPPATGNPIPWLLFVLLCSIGLPFFALSTSTSLLQKLFSTTGHRSARDPYFLYAASNVGSLLALVAYPFLVEPTWALRTQSRLWAIGYAAFVVCALISIIVNEAKASYHECQGNEAKASSHECQASANHGQTENDDRVSWRQRGKWTLLAFIPSSLMLGVTSYLATDIAAVPLLWVVPLGLYLLTFVVAFGAPRPRWRAIADRRLPALIVALTIFMILHVVGPVWVVAPIHLAAFTLAAFLCHADLALARPSPGRLTEFYFWVAFGGMLGGIFNTLVAPAIFSSIVEYPLALLAACVVRVGWRAEVRGRFERALDLMAPVAIGALTAGLIVSAHTLGASPRLALFLPAALVFSQAARPIRFTTSVAALLVTGWVTPHANTDGDVLHRERTFFGVYRVTVDPSGRYRSLYHGTTLHGMQALDTTRRHESLTYYHRTGPLGQAFGRLPQLSRTPDVAVVGLGVGTLAAYAGPQQRWTFYEIDPAVERIARTSEYFTYLDACGSRCRVVLGDARLSLARAPRAEYGLIVLDAFSSDAIPMHLMTSEALALYLSRLAPDGIIAFHISNRHLSLGPVLHRLALEHRLVALEQKDWSGDGGVQDNGKSSSDWVLLARRKDDLDPLARDGRWASMAAPLSTPLWTDDFSNILGVLTRLD